MAALMVASMADLGPMLDEYVTAAAELLASQGRAVESVVKVAPGVAPAWDNSCSQLYARFVSASPGGQANAAAPNPCGYPYWVVAVAIAVTRCVGTPDVAGGRIKLPSPARVTQDGFDMIADLAALEQIVKCGRYTRSVVSALPLPEAGGLAGVEWTFTVRVDNCACPEAPEG